MCVVVGAFGVCRTRAFAKVRKLSSRRRRCEIRTPSRACRVQVMLPSGMVRELVLWLGDAKDCASARLAYYLHQRSPASWCQLAQIERPRLVQPSTQKLRS